MDRLLDFNPLSGVAAWFCPEADGSITLKHTQQTDAIIEANKLSMNAEAHTTAKGIEEGWWHYASLPAIVVMKWSAEVGGDILSAEYEKELFKRLNSPENAYLKATYGKHAPAS